MGSAKLEEEEAVGNWLSWLGDIFETLELSVFGYGGGGWGLVCKDEAASWDFYRCSEWFLVCLLLANGSFSLFLGIFIPQAEKGVALN